MRAILLVLPSGLDRRSLTIVFRPGSLNQCAKRPKRLPKAGPFRSGSLLHPCGLLIPCIHVVCESRSPLALLGNKLRQDVPSLFDFVPIYRVRHTRIASQGNDCAKRSENRRCFLDPFPGDVRIGIARAEKGESTRETARIVKSGSGRPDQPASKRDEPAVPGSISRHEFRRETRALREASYHDLVSLYASFDSSFD